MVVCSPGFGAAIKSFVPAKLYPVMLGVLYLSFTVQVCCGMEGAVKLLKFYLSFCSDFYLLGHGAVYRKNVLSVTGGRKLVPKSKGR